MAVDRGFMTVSEHGREIGRVPLDQIGSVIANAHGITYSNNFLVKLAEQNAPLVICAANHVPVSVMLPLDGHHLQSSIMSLQAQMKETTLNRFWKDIIQAKLKQQAAVLETCGYSCAPLHFMARQVKSGDPENLEGQGARFYFQELFGADFRRDRMQNGINALLNYGYTVLRSAVIRAIVGAGLHPSLGIHHCNQYNPMCLADDLMEPFRPLVDFCVHRIISDGIETVSIETKKRLVALLSCSMETDKGAEEVNSVILRTVVSYAQCIKGEGIKIDLPKPMKEITLWGL